MLTWNNFNPPFFRQTPISMADYLLKKIETSNIYKYLSYVLLDMYKKKYATLKAILCN